MHECIQQETIGKFKEFIDSMKGFRTTLFTIALAIVVQVVAFVYMWGGLTTTVSKNSDQIWCKLTPTAEKNQLNIEKILTRLDTIRFVYAGEKGNTGATGVQGIQGIQGIQGKNYDSKKE